MDMTGPIGEGKDRFGEGVADKKKKNGLSFFLQFLVKTYIMKTENTTT